MTSNCTKRFGLRVSSTTPNPTNSPLLPSLSAVSRITQPNDDGRHMTMTLHPTALLSSPLHAFVGRECVLLQAGHPNFNHYNGPSTAWIQVPARNSPPTDSHGFDEETGLRQKHIRDGWNFLPLWKCSTNIFLFHFLPLHNAVAPIVTRLA